jgi:hypothetical protein
MSHAIRVRNLREGEASTLPAALLDTGMLYLVPEWVWVVEMAVPISPLGPFTPPSSFPPPAPFAIVVASQAHSWLVLWRILTISPLPLSVPLNWFLEAIPQVFEQARIRGCAGFVTILSDDRPQEVKLARIIARLAKGGIMPFQGSIGAGMLM